MMNDALCVVHPRAAGLDVHKGHITATVRLSDATAGTPRCETRMFSALASGLAALVAWLTGHRVGAASMEATGVYWHTPWQALTNAGIEAQLLHAQHVKQLRGRKTDVEDSRWLARVCQFGLGRPSFVPSQQFRDLRVLSRHRRKLVARRSRVRNQTQKVIDRAGIRIGVVLTDIFGTNGRRILDGLVNRLHSTDILASLSAHVRRKLDQLGDALRLTLRETEHLLLADLLREHDAVSRRVHDFDRHLDQALAPCAEQRRLLETLPGIDRTAACAILSETGADPHRVFGNAQRLAAWAGLCPGNNESAGKRRSGRTRRGNQTLRAVLIECAPRRRPYQQLPVPGVSSGSGQEARLQARHRRHRPQAAAMPLRGAPRRHALPRPGHRLRGAARPAQRAALGAQAATVRHSRPQRRRHLLGALAGSTTTGRTSHRTDIAIPRVALGDTVRQRGHLGQPRRSNLNAHARAHRRHLS